ncbi:MAG: flavodoxin family protein [Proteobacteria bacterium]|nr:flavodoxin family protein [Pseudomonadota bacterium]
MLRIVAFHGSPRVDGNSDILLQEALKPIYKEGHEVKLFKLNLMNIKPCQNCGGCDETGLCVIHDEMSEIYDAVRAADRVILSSPIFFFALSAQTKIMIDRFQCFWCEKYLLGKPIPEGEHGRKGLLLLVGGMTKDIGVQCGEAAAKAFFRTISVPKHETLSYLGIDYKGAILHHPTALNDVSRAGERLIKQEEE